MMTFSEWAKQPFLWAGQGIGGATSWLKGSGTRAVTFLERPLALAVLTALLAGFSGGLASRMPLPALPSWHWPWHWPTPTPPVPPAPPVPPSPPAPIPEAGFRVLIVVKEAELSKLPAGQVTALTSTAVRQYLNAKCAVGPDGETKEWRIWDSGIDASNESALWQDALKRAAGKPLPWLIISNPGHGDGYEGALPADAGVLLKLLQQHGG